ARAFSSRSSSCTRTPTAPSASPPPSAPTCTARKRSAEAIRRGIIETMPMHEQIQHEIRAIRRERISRARQLHPLDKAFSGAELFDMVRARMAWGVAADMPGADEPTIHREVQRRLAM